MGAAGADLTPAGAVPDDDGSRPSRAGAEPRLARNVLVNVVGWALPAVVAVAAMPVLARRLGPDRFGLLGLAWTLVGYAALLDFGLGRATTQVVATRLGRVPAAALSATAWTALALLAGVAAVVAIPLAVAAGPLAREALRVPAALVDEAVMAARWIAVAVPFAVMAGGLRGLLEAAQRFGTINALRVPLAVATYVGPLAAAVLLPASRALVWSVALVAATRATFAVLHAVACWRALPWLRTRPRYAHADARALLATAGWLSLSNVLNPVLIMLDRVALGTAVSAAALGYYTGAYEVATKLQVVTGAVFPVFFPAIAHAVVASPGRAASLVSASARLVLVSLVPAALALAALAPELLGVWLGAPFATGAAGALRVLTVGLLVNCVGQSAYHALQAVGWVRLTVVFHAAQLVPYAAALWWVAPRYGVAGVAGVVCARLVVDAALVWTGLARALPAVRAVQRRELGYGAAALVPVAGVAFLPDEAWLKVLAVLGLSAAHLALAWRLLADEDQRAAVQVALAGAARRLRRSAR